ncbi:MAG: DUF4091 domain-containing protein [Kiritimatiellae bacterium]|nr:DUF4091 domain-containing protein [Kiritimatiellia bacterium]
MKKILFAGIFAAGAAAGLDVTAWKGETVNAFLARGERVFNVPQGWQVKVGGCKAVPYASKPHGEVDSKAFDRVVWGDREPGPKIVQVKVPRNAAAGEYRMGALKVKVLDKTLPPVKERAYYLDLWQHPWAVARWNKVEPFSKEHYAAMEPLWKALAELGQKTVTVTLTDLPWNHQCYDGYGTMVRHIKKADGSWAFDYKVFDEYVAFALGCGLGPDISCYTLCPWGYRVSWEDEEGNAFKEEAKPGSELFNDYWGAFLPDFAAHLKEKGWFAQTLVAMDERSPEDVRIIADFVQKKAPGMRVAMAGNRAPSEFDGIKLDVYSQYICHITSKYLADAAERRAQGLVSTAYVCCGPDEPNTFMRSNPAEAFCVALYPAAAGLDGFLRWAYNSWPEDPARDASFGNWTSGDTFLVYPNGEPSVRLLMFQNGLEAAEKCRVAGKQKELAELMDVTALLKGKGPYFESVMHQANDILNKE